MMHRAGQLRRSPTPAEARLWAYLRDHQLGGVGFRRQHAIGRYVVDFCSPRRRLVIEIDGSPHEASRNSDAERTRWLESKGWRVLLFWNAQIMDDIEQVGEVILAAIAEY